MLSGWVRRALNLYPGEERECSLLALLAFLYSFAIGSAITLGDGQFLEYVGTQGLPWVYLGTGIAMCIGAALLLQLLKRLRVPHLFQTLLCSSAVLFLLLGGIASTPLLASSLTYGAIKLFSDMFLVVLLTGFWSLVDERYDLQRAKRVVGLLSGAQILGNAVGGAFVSLLIMRLGAAPLLWTSALTFGVAALALRLTPLHPKESIASRPSPPSDSLPQMQGMGEVASHVKACSFALQLLLFNICLATLPIVMEFCYMGALQSAFANGKEAELTSFLGSWRCFVYLGDMAIGLFLYSRLIQRLGVRNASLLSSGTFFLLFLCWNPLPGLVAAVLGLIAVEGIIPTIEDASFNLLVRAIPKRFKTSFRVLLEHFMEPIGILLASLLLLVTTSIAPLIGFLVAASAFVIAMGMRITYPKAILNALHSEEAEYRAATDENPSAQCALEESLAFIKNQADSPEMIHQAIHEAEEERSRLPFELYLAWLKEREEKHNNESLHMLLLSDCPLHIRVGISLITMQRSPHHFGRLLPLVNHPEHLVRRDALRGLHELAHPSTPISHLRELVRRINIDPEEQKTATRAIMALGSRAIPLLLPLMRDRRLKGAGRLLAARSLQSLTQPSRPTPTFLFLVQEEIQRTRAYYDQFSPYLEFYPDLADPLKEQLDFTLQIIGLLKPLEDPHLLVRSLDSGDSYLQGHAIETIEKLCDAKSFRRLLPLIDPSRTYRSRPSDRDKHKLLLSLTTTTDSPPRRVSYLDRQIFLALAQSLLAEAS